MLEGSSVAPRAGSDAVDAWLRLSQREALAELFGSAWRVVDREVQKHLGVRQISGDIFAQEDASFPYAVAVLAHQHFGAGTLDVKREAQAAHMLDSLLDYYDAGKQRELAGFDFFDPEWFQAGQRRDQDALEKATNTPLSADMDRVLERLIVPDLLRRHNSFEPLKAARVRVLDIGAEAAMQTLGDGWLPPSSSYGLPPGQTWGSSDARDAWVRTLAENQDASRDLRLAAGKAAQMLPATADHPAELWIPSPLAIRILNATLGEAPPWLTPDHPAWLFAMEVTEHETVHGWNEVHRGGFGFAISELHAILNTTRVPLGAEHAYDDLREIAADVEDISELSLAAALPLSLTSANYCTMMTSIAAGIGVQATAELFSAMSSWSSSGPMAVDYDYFAAMGGGDAIVDSVISTAVQRDGGRSLAEKLQQRRGKLGSERRELREKRGLLLLDSLTDQLPQGRSDATLVRRAGGWIWDCESSARQAGGLPSRVAIQGKAPAVPGRPRFPGAPSASSERR